MFSGFWKPNILLWINTIKTSRNLKHWFFFSVLQTHSSWEQLEGCLLQVGVYILSRAAGEGLCLPLLRGVWRRSGEMGLTVQDPPVCWAGLMSNPMDTYQQCEAVLWQHPILLDKPLSGCTGELRERVPKLVDIDHLLGVCVWRQRCGIVEHQGRQVGLWHKPEQREQMGLILDVWTD